MTEDDQGEDRNSWGHEGAEPEIFGEEEGSDPAAAFEALRRTTEGLAADLVREMITIRKGVEAAFDQFERQGASVDYSAELAQMTQQFTAVAERMKGLENSPLLRQGAEHYARVIERGVEGGVRSAVRELQQEGRSLRSVAQDLADQSFSARDRRRQDWWLVGIGGAGIVLGILLTLFTPRVLPFSAAPRIASTVMGDTAWQAGMSLLSYASPGSVSRVADADRLVTSNKDAIEDCRQVAAKSAKEQKCTIIVPVPEKSP